MFSVNPDQYVYIRSVYLDTRIVVALVNLSLLTIVPVVVLVAVVVVVVVGVLVGVITQIVVYSASVVVAVMMAMVIVGHHFVDIVSQFSLSSVDTVAYTHYMDY